MNNPEISIIILTYNREEMVQRAIDSVLNQTYKNFELIVVDDGSTDNTEKVIRKLQKKDGRIKYFKHEENRGGAAARNKGFKLSKSKSIVFLDSDDEALIRRLKKSIRKLLFCRIIGFILYPKYQIRKDIMGVIYSSVYNLARQK